MAHSTSAAEQRHVRNPNSTGGEPHDFITSRENRWLKSFRAALQGRGPQSGEPIGVEGPKMVEDALRAGLKAEALLVSESGERDAERVLRAARECDSGIRADRILRTTDRLFQSVTDTKVPQGVAALIRQREWGIEEVLRGSGAMRESAPLVAVLVAVQDPGNVGTIVRSAEAFGATGVVATRGTADPWSPKALRASAGSALRLPLLRAMAIPILTTQLKIAGVKLYAATSAQAKAGNLLGSSLEVDWSGPVAIFIGNEGGGLPPEVRHSVDRMISIPTTGHVESLNAGIAASILLYEAARQRTLENR